MKGKKLQPRILYPARLSFRWWRDQKLPRQAKIKRIQHHQTSFTTNAKGTSLGRKHKSRERPTENKPQTIKKTVIGLYISISSVQFSHSVMSDSLQPHEPQHARPPCPSPTPRVYPNPCPLSRWCHTTISLSSHSPPALNFSQHQGLFKWVSSSHQVTKGLEFQLQHQSLQWMPRTDLL